MISIDTLRKLLAIADVHRDPYAVAGAAQSLLATNPQDTFAAGQYVRALTSLKLTSAGQRLLGTAPGNGEGRGGGGMIPWSSRARRFSANIRALVERDPTGAALVEATAKDLGKYELHQAADGNFQVLDLAAGGLPWLGGLADHKAATVLWDFDPRQTPIPHPIAFDGLGFGWLFLRVLQSTANSYLNYSCALYILESDLMALAMALHMHDLQHVIADPRTRWFIGHNPTEVMETFRTKLREEEAWTIPERFVRCALRPRSALDLEKAIHDLRQDRESRRTGLLQEIETHYRDKGPSYWRQRFTEAQAGGEKLRVLGITSRYTTVLQHSMAELQAAANETGAYDFDLAIEPDDQSLENPFVEKIAQHKPDLIVQISRLRHENPLLPRNIPFLSWDQDNLPCMRTPEATASLDALTYIAGHGAIFGWGHLQWPERNCIFCHPAGAAIRYSNAPAAPELLAKHSCDLSYVSNASATPAELAIELRPRWSREPALAAIFDASTTDILVKSAAGTCFDDITLQAFIQQKLREAAVMLEPPVLHELTMDLHRYADRCFRQTTLVWVHEWCLTHHKTLRLYGRGWEKHPSLARWAAGPAEPGEMLRGIYQASRINLQIIESGFIHSRALDGLAAGGFFLTRQVAGDGRGAEEAQTLREIHLLGKWVVENGIQSPIELAAAPAAMQDRWKKTLAHHPWLPDHAIKVLKVWAKTPYAVVAFPMLPQVSFSDKATFAAQAEHFLSDDPERRRIADQMREIVLQQFSYQSRWKEFMAHVARGLEVAAR